MRMQPRQNIERNAYIVALRRAGYTLEAIGDAVGITRERARQLLAREGIRGRSLAAPAVDPVQLMRYARSPEATSFRDVAAHVGVSEQTVSHTLYGLGAAPALLRLYKWREGARRRAQIVAGPQAWSAAHGGRTPTMHELNDPTIDLPAEKKYTERDRVMAMRLGFERGYRRAAGFSHPGGRVISEYAALEFPLPKVRRDRTLTVADPGGLPHWTTYRATEDGRIESLVDAVANRWALVHYVPYRLITQLADLLAPPTEEVEDV